MLRQVGAKLCRTPALRDRTWWPLLYSEWVPSEWDIKQMIKAIKLSTSNLWVPSPSFFISCSHSHGTQSLQRIHWCASDVIINWSKSVLMKKINSSTSWMAWGWVHFILNNYLWLHLRCCKCNSTNGSRWQCWIINRTRTKDLQRLYRQWYSIH